MVRQILKSHHLKVVRQSCQKSLTSLLSRTERRGQQPRWEGRSLAALRWDEEFSPVPSCRRRSCSSTQSLVEALRLIIVKVGCGHFITCNLRTGPRTSVFMRRFRSMKHVKLKGAVNTAPLWRESAQRPTPWIAVRTSPAFDPAVSPHAELLSCHSLTDQAGFSKCKRKRRHLVIVGLQKVVTLRFDLGFLMEIQAGDISRRKRLRRCNYSHGGFPITNVFLIVLEATARVPRGNYKGGWHCSDSAWEPTRMSRR
jgi:hypothetical protein